MGGSELARELVADLPALLSPDQAAEFWGVSTRTLRRWEAAGRLRVVRVGRVLRIPRTEIERLLEESAR